MLDVANGHVGEAEGQPLATGHWELRPPSKSPEKLNVANNQVSLEADSCLIEPADETTAQADTLTAASQETLTQKTQQSLARS